MAGKAWWVPETGEPPVYLGEVVDDGIDYPGEADTAGGWLPDLNVTFTADLTVWNAGMQKLLLSVGMSHSIDCPV